MVYGWSFGNCPGVETTGILYWVADLDLFPEVIFECERLPGEINSRSPCQRLDVLTSVSYPFRHWSYIPIAMWHSRNTKTTLFKTPYFKNSPVMGGWVWDAWGASCAGRDEQVNAQAITRSVCSIPPLPFAPLVYKKWFPVNEVLNLPAAVSWKSDLWKKRELRGGVKWVRERWGGVRLGISEAILSDGLYSL